MFTTLFEAGPYAFSIYALFLLAAFAAAGALAVWVVIREKGSSISWWFFALAGTMMWWLFCRALSATALDLDLAVTWTRLSYAAFPFLPSCTLQFAFEAIGREPKPLRRLIGVWSASGAFMILSLTSDLLVAGVIRYPWGFYPKYGSAGLLFILFFVVTGGASVGVFYNAIRGLPRGRQRRRLTRFAVGYLIGFAGVIDFIAAYGIPILPLGHFVALGSIIVVGITIRRFQLFDITPAFAASNIISTMQDALLVADDEGRIRIVNQALQDISGYTRAELLGARLGELLTMPPRGDATLLSRSGELIPVSLSVSRLLDREQAVGTVVTAHDLRERRRIESTLGNLVGGVAHEVRNPLFAISSTIDAFEKLGDERRPELIGVLREQIARLSDFMYGLLDLGRPALAALMRAPFGPIIENAIADCAREAGARGVTISYQPRVRFAAVEADEVRLRQAFRNIIQNGVQFSPKGGAVTVRTELAEAVDGPRLLCTVSDEGPGLDPPDIAKAFEPFFTRRTGGTGLGLSITRAVIEQHYGTIAIGNQPAGGAIVSVELPLLTEIKA